MPQVIDEQRGLVRVLTRPPFRDARGHLQKVITAHELMRFGEVYAVQAGAGVRRGDHYHPRTGEWFTALSGDGELWVWDRSGGASQRHVLDPARGETFYVRPGLAHVLVAGSSGLLALAVADTPYDPTDTVPCCVPEPAA